MNRESMQYDVVIIGGRPSGLATACNGDRKEVAIHLDGLKASWLWAELPLLLF
jgi:thioredoxin reductase